MNQERFLYLKSKYERLINLLSYRFAGNPQDRDDLKSEGFLVLLKSVPKEEDYLGRKIKFSMLRYVRKNRKKGPLPRTATGEWVETCFSYDLDALIGNIKDTRLKFIAEKILDCKPLTDAERQYFHRKKGSLLAIPSKIVTPSIWENTIQKLQN